MSGLTSRQAAMAFAKFGANSWGAAASVTKGVYFESDGGWTLQPQRVNDNSFGQAFLGDGDFGDVTAPDLTWPAPDRYEDHTYILEALAMGSPAAVTIATSAASQTTSWRHVIDLAPNIDGLGITAAIDKVLFVDELTSAKVYGFTDEIGDGGVMRHSFRLLGTKPTQLSSVNTRSTVRAATFPSLANRIFRKQGVFRMNGASAGTLTANDAVTIESWSLAFERPQDAPFVFSQDYVHEPGDNGHPTFRIQVTFPRMNTVSANSMYQALQSDPTFKADLTYSGGFINSTDRYSKQYQFPALELDAWQASVTGPNQVKPTATLMAKLAASSVSGMPFVNPMRITRIMTNSVHAFA